MKKIFIFLIIIYTQQLFSYDLSSLLFIYDTPQIEGLVKANIYSFMKAKSIYDHTPLLTFESSGNFLDSRISDVVPLVFIVNGERVETLWGFENGVWKILKVNIIWEDSLFHTEEEDDSLLSKTVKFTSGFNQEDSIDKYETENWILEVGLERSYFENFGIVIDFSFNNIVDEEDLSVKTYEFESKVRAKLEQSLYLNNRDLSLTAYLTGGIGFKVHFSNQLDENVLTEESFGIKDYYSFPTIFTAGFEYTNNALTPRLAAGIELNYEIERPYYAFFKSIEEDENFQYITFIPTLYVKWVY